MSGVRLSIDKELLFSFIRSHSKLAQAEFNRNSSYNNTHFSYLAESNMSKELEKLSLLDEFLNSMTDIGE